MASDIKKMFGSLDIVITNKMISNFDDIVASWENRKNAPLVLHGQLIGVYDVYFVQMDRDNLFHLVGTEESVVKSLIKYIPAINPKFNVLSDPFNLLTVWMLHLAEVQIKNKKIKEGFKLNLLKYLHYKFFTALTKKQFPHTVDEGIMIATIMDLSRKFDLIKYGSWWEVIDARCKDILKEESIHRTTLLLGEPDDKILYLIVDSFNRMSAKIKLIADAFYKHHAAGKSVASSSATMTDAEGEKILVERSSTIQKVDSRLSRDLLSVNAWVNTIAVNNVGSQFPAISKSLIKLALKEMSAVATIQAKTKQFDPYKTVNGDRIIVGMSQLVKTIVVTSASIVASKGIPLSNTFMAWKALKNAFSASMTLDPEILLIKSSVAYFVDGIGDISRPATKISLRMAIIMYVIYKFILLAK